LANAGSIRSRHFLDWQLSAIQWKEDPAVPDGGQDYPDKILREPHRNIRAWLQDGFKTIWIFATAIGLANLRMANALKARTTISVSALEKELTTPRTAPPNSRRNDLASGTTTTLPELRKTFEIDPAEKAKPVFASPSQTATPNNSEQTQVDHNLRLSCPSRR